MAKKKDAKPQGLTPDGQEGWDLGHKSQVSANTEKRTGRSDATAGQPRVGHLSEDSPADPGTKKGRPDGFSVPNKAVLEDSVGEFPVTELDTDEHVGAREISETDETE